MYGQQYTKDRVPDPRVVRRMKELDEHLEVAWNARDHRWELWRVKHEWMPLKVWTVEKPDGGYEEFGYHTIEELRKCDLSRRRRGRTLLDEIDRQNYEMVRKRKEDFSDNVRQMAKEHRSLIRKMADDSAIGNWRGWSDD